MEITPNAPPRPQPSAEPAAASAPRRRAEAEPAPAASPARPSEEAVAQINELLRAQQQSLQFSLDEESHRMIYRVIDTVSGEVIRQIPSEAMVDLARTLARAGSGLLDTQA